MTALSTDADPDLDALVRAAHAAAAALPAAVPLTPASAQPGDEQVPTVFPVALVAERVDGPGLLGLLVGDEVVTAAGGPEAVAAAVQPALDAVAEALELQLAPARSIAPAEFSAALGDAWSVVPLVGEGFAGAVAGTADLLHAVNRSGDLAPVTVPVSSTIVDPPPTVSSSAVTHEPVVTGAVTVPSGGEAYRSQSPVPRGIEMLHDIDMELTVELGRSRMLVRDLLALAPGDVVELDRAAGSPADLLVGGRLIARGEVVVVDEDFGLRITHIVESNAG